MGLFLFYKIIKCFLFDNDNSNKPIPIISIISILVGIEILLFALSKKYNCLNFWPNESVFSILIAAQLLFVTPYVKKINESVIGNKNRAEKVLACYFLICYCLLFYTEGRGGILAFSICLCIFHYGNLKSKAGYFKGILLCILLLFLLLNIKGNSSSGRLFIYKVIITQLEPKQFVTGIGYGKFSAKYNELQAQYFSTESIDSKEALLASNTYYMFNDPLQLIIETGLVGIIIIIFLLIKFLTLFRRNYSFFSENELLYGTYLSVICIIISSLFSYPFQIMGILLHFLFCTAIIIHADRLKYSSKYTIFLQKRQIIFSRISLLLAAICLLFFGHASFKFYIELNEAIKYSNNGFRKKAIQTYHKISHNSVQDRDILFNYADELAKVNKIDSALIILYRSLDYLNNDKSAVLMGNLFEEKGMFLDAEKQYKKAVFINPKLFANRSSLFKFYCETKQYKKAIHWGNSILNMPVKIPSKTITAIKNETKILLLKMQKLTKN